MEEKNIYNMELHEIMEIEKNIRIVRVAGGWIYKAASSESSFVFVPFDDEFMKRERKRPLVR